MSGPGGADTAPGPSVFNQRGRGRTVCVNNHDPDRTEVRPDGRRVCLDCQAKYQGRANRGRRVNQSKRDERRATRAWEIERVRVQP
ncbi:hypothetical protein GCM10023214_15840 [Amycolatopsis dongchuanensis]|uniref:Uncharacterized protein n=1 Tax=Amycolatopsis dongchuanensis TaxID=1070866 RepID=A0ABP9Q650_9PSEU